MPNRFRVGSTSTRICSPGNDANDEVTEGKVDDAFCRAVKLLFDRLFWRQAWMILERVPAQDLDYMYGSATITAGAGAICCGLDM